jgi:hypothetical protein
VFITHDKMHLVRRQLAFGMLADTDKFMREIFGDEFFEVFSKARDAKARRKS